jgi:uncharacterized protein (PEP-CTERM system associated)
MMAHAARPAMMAHAARPAMTAYAARLALMVCGASLIVPQALAFPISDASNPSVVPFTSGAGSAAAPDASDASALAHQLQLLSPFGGTTGPGWTFTPSLTLQEALNDNVFQTETDRRWDLISYVTPGIAISGDTQNVQLRLVYQPTVEYYVRNTSLNQLAQQLNAVGDITLWQDHLYLDLRATAGVGSASGSQPGLGYGAGASGQPTTGLTGLTKQNSTQFTSFAASPYFLQQFDTYGTLKLGYTLSYSTSSNNAGFTALPVNTTGPSATQTTNEGLVQFTTGTFLERTTDTVLVDASQFQGSGATPSGHNDIATNQVTYVVNRGISVLGSFGYEDIDYGGLNSLAIHDLTWQVGTTLTPNPRSTLTMSYGHVQGANSLSVNGLYAATARTSINVNYAQQLGTELQQLESQLSATTINDAGIPVNSRTGAPLTNGNNLLGTPSQLYRSETATVGTTTQLDRDIITLNLQYAAYTSAGAGASGSTNGLTGTANWTHSLSDDLTLNVSGSYGLRWLNDPGARNAFIAATGSLRYALSATVSTSLSYAFYDLNSTEQGQSLYQNVLILSLTKQF